MTDFDELFMKTLSEAFEDKLMDQIMTEPVPEHIAVIMDGNRRYAQDKGEEPIKGHIYGKNRLKELLEWCLDLKIRFLTVYAFSTENFNRHRGEVEILMDMFVKNFNELAKKREKLMKEKVRVRVLGNLDLLPSNVTEAILNVQEMTKNNDDYHFNLAIAYGGREEITNAVKEIAREVKAGNINPEDVDQGLISSYLYTHDLPDPDLILRTSGEIRLSNFLIWQMAYSEFYFTDVYWPGFTKSEFLKAIRSYQMRKRRFGK